MEAAAIETIEFDVVAGNYGEFIERLRTVLAAGGGDRRSVADYRHAPHPVLPPQRRPHPPARWILIVLRFREDQGRHVHETTLAVRDDNLYLIGFRNRRGLWYEFGFSGGRSTRRLLPEEWNSTFLECDVGYGSLLAGGAMSLVSHRLGRLFAREAVRRLSAYEQAGGGGGVDELTRQHLARLVVMVCEAARMIPHCNTVLDGWDRLTGGALDARQVHLLWKWKVMSHAVLRWEQWRRDSMWRVPVPPPPTWPPALLDRRVNVRNVGQALEIVQLLLNWSPPPILQHYWQGDGDGGPVVGGGGDGAHGGGLGQQQHQQGQCMLEIYGVRAGFYMCGGTGATTISVFDGMRGQIIYSNDDDEEDLGRTTTASLLDHGDVGDSKTRHGGHFSDRMFAHLRSIYDWAGFGYWNQRKTITSKQEKAMWSTLGHDLVLAGPYRAISAHGSVSIEIDTSSTSTDTDSNVELGISTAETADYVRIDIDHDAGRSRTTTTKLLLWDCSNNDDNAAYDYDTVLTRTISTSHGPLDVTYAVLSNAVECTVHVRLVLADEQGSGGGDILVHGRITAGGRDLDAESVLFCRDVEERVAVTRDDDCYVPLSRSVVAVPLASELLIAAALHTTIASSSSSSSNHAAAPAAEELLPDQPLVARFLPEPSGEEVQRFGIDSGHVEIKVVWALDF